MSRTVFPGAPGEDRYVDETWLCFDGRTGTIQVYQNKGIVPARGYPDVETYYFGECLTPPVLPQETP